MFFSLFTSQEQKVNAKIQGQVHSYEETKASNNTVSRQKKIEQ